MKHDFEVIVIGGGHAGTEAGHAAARMGVSTAIVTMRHADLGVMSCNPAIGGLGKGHLVREIDALDGVMGRAADAAGIQFRLLNRRKGPAVQGPRAQCDRELYHQAVLRMTREQPNLSVVEGEVVDILMDGTSVVGVELGDGTRITSRAVILTSGTFLRGEIHVGDKRHAGGRMGDRASTRLADRLDSIGLNRGRLKTGTPPRIHRESVTWSDVEMQPGDEEPTLFSFLSKAPVVRQVECGIVRTNSITHEIIRENLTSSAMYGGHISGVGPRYCPSIEDKIVRFSEKSGHQVFLEPEGLRSELIYPNGISTSLPLSVQETFVRSINGLENAVICQPGYAIEYDYFDPRGLTLGLAVYGLSGLFFAGQINGTTGYEEAAAQGLVAGLNAARFSRDQDELAFRRSESYIGVMIDDLTTQGVMEPYRMFTSRAEYRLSLRADNADQRLTPKGLDLGCVGERRRESFVSKMEKLDNARERVEAIRLSPHQLREGGMAVGEDGRNRTALEVMSLPQFEFSKLAALVPDLESLPVETLSQLQREARYATYIARQSRDVEALKGDELVLIPAGFDFALVDGLSNELREKFSKVRPETLSQAARIEGATPAALTLLLARLRRDERKRA